MADPTSKTSHRMLHAMMRKHGLPAWQPHASASAGPTMEATIASHGLTAQRKPSALSLGARSARNRLMKGNRNLHASHALIHHKAFDNK